MRYSHVLNENQQQLWYHGSGHTISKFSLDHTKWENTNQYGPGVYFTNQISTAESYASGNDGKIYVCEIRPRKVVSTKTKVNATIVKKLITTAPGDTWNNWAETKAEAYRQAINNVLNYNDNMYDTLLSIWSDWYRGDEKLFLSKLVGYGIDGALVNPSDNEQFFIAYNVDALSLVKVLAKNPKE